MTLHPIPSVFLIYEENVVFFFISVDLRRLEIGRLRVEHDQVGLDKTPAVLVSHGYLKNQHHRLPNS